MKPLTRRQKEILDFIVGFREREGISPTHREICEHFGFSSYGTAHKHLKLLREKGYLKRHTYQRRGMEPLEEESDALPGARQLSFFGQIAAGRPIEALPGPERMMVPDHLLNGGEHYVLRVQGDSMIEEGVHDGDLVVVASRPEAHTGEMVVALVEGEVTLKRFFPEGSTIRLQPANRAMAPIEVPATSVTIQGVVVGLMRRY